MIDAKLAGIEHPVPETDSLPQDRFEERLRSKQRTAQPDVKTHLPGLPRLKQKLPCAAPVDVPVMPNDLGAQSAANRPQCLEAMPAQGTRMEVRLEFIASCPQSVFIEERFCQASGSDLATEYQVYQVRN